MKKDKSNSIKIIINGMEITDNIEELLPAINNNRVIIKKTNFFINIYNHLFVYSSFYLIFIICFLTFYIYVKK